MNDRLSNPVWRLLKEPKIVSASLASAYFLIAINGIIILVAQHGWFKTATGVLLSIVIGGSLIVGGILGVFSLHGGDWWMERACIFLVWAGLGGYIISLWAFSDGLIESIVRTDFTIVFLLFTFTRFYKIQGATLDPLK